MPAFALDRKNFICCGAWQNHLSFYPLSHATRRAFADELAGYNTSGKGTIRFPSDEDLPTSLVIRLVRGASPSGIYAVISYTVAQKKQGNRHSRGARCTTRRAEEDVRRQRTSLERNRRRDRTHRRGRALTADVRTAIRNQPRGSSHIYGRCCGILAPAAVASYLPARRGHACGSCGSAAGRVKRRHPRPSHPGTPLLEASGRGLPITFQAREDAGPFNVMFNI
jgi:hypothetical protein